MSIVTADNYKRVRIPDAKPGQSFEYQLAGNVVKLIPVKPDIEDIPVVKLVKGKDGFLTWPRGARPSREQIVAAIRADREAQ